MVHRITGQRMNRSAQFVERPARLGVALLGERLLNAEIQIRTPSKERRMSGVVAGSVAEGLFQSGK